MKQYSLNLALGLSLVMLSVAMCQVPWVRSAHSDPNPAEIATPSPGPASTAPLTAAESKRLLQEFQRAQSAELKALDHRGKLELKELKASHNARQHEWERKEKEARHKFFEEHTRGPDRRAFIKDFMDRHRRFLQLLAEEANQRIHDQEVHYKALQEDQVSRLKEFQQALERGERPPSKLWTTSG